jgi:hypothetical protein
MRSARALACMAFALTILIASPASAETWQWQNVLQVPGKSPMSTRSIVVLSPAGVSIVYSALISNSYQTVTWCKVDLHDIAAVETVPLNGRNFLRLRLKPQRFAQCDSGSEPIAIAPIPDEAAASGAVAAIGQACCTRSLPNATPTPSPPASKAPAPSAAFVPARLVHRGSSRLAIGQKGTAVLRVSVGANGMPQNATIVKISNPLLVAAAIETAISSTYSPAARNGRPVSDTYIAMFSFDGEDPAQASIPVWERNRSPSPSATATP